MWHGLIGENPKTRKEKRADIQEQEEFQADVEQESEWGQQGIRA